MIGEGDESKGPVQRFGFEFLRQLQHRRHPAGIVIHAGRADHRIIVGADQYDLLGLCSAGEIGLQVPEPRVFILIFLISDQCREYAEN